jgi:hypothetical protein
MEPLEDRTLLSGPDWSTVGPGLVSIFTQLQAGVNDHLLAPNKVQYSLPLVGDELGQSSDPVGQVFAGLANQIMSAFTTTPSGPPDVVAHLNTALNQYNHQVTNSPPGSATFNVQASSTAPLTENLALELGLPGLGLFLHNVSANQAVTASLTFSLNLTFGIDSSGVFVDPTQNNANSPLLKVEVQANLNGFTGAAADLNGVPVQITDETSPPASTQNPSHLDVPVAFNSSATARIHGFSAANIDQVDFATNAEGDVNLHYALNVANALKLMADLGVKWPLSSTTVHVSPFDSLSDGRVPTVTLEAGADLGSLVTELNPASSHVLQELDKDIKPLQDVVDFLYNPIPVLSPLLSPVLSPLGITLTPRYLLGLLPSKYTSFLPALDVFHDVLDAVGSFTLPAGVQVNFASSTLPSTLDPRIFTPSSAGLASAFEANAQQESSNVQITVDPLLQALGNALDGTIQLPILDNPSLAFEALLTDDNVALFQYTINPVNFGVGMPPDSPINLGPPIGPIVPPFPIFLQLTAGFGLSAGFTLGYDTWGFHNPANNPVDGLFLANASAQFTGCDPPTHR